MKMFAQFVAILTMLHGWGLALVQRLMANLRVVGWSARQRQRGASALEYIMLAAVIVGLLVAVALAYDSEAKNPIIKFFNDLFDTAGEQTGTG